MLWLGRKLNAKRMALTRFMAHAKAPLTAQFNYPALMRDQITVALLYGREFLHSSASAWPVSYQAMPMGYFASQVTRMPTPRPSCWASRLGRSARIQRS